MQGERTSIALPAPALRSISHTRPFFYWIPNPGRHILEDSTYCSDPADLPLELRGIAGPTEWTLLYWFSTVDRPVRCSTNVKRVMHVIIELAGICGVFLTGRQDFSCLKDGRNILFKSTESNTISDTRSNYTLGMMVISIIPAHRGITSYRTA